MVPGLSAKKPLPLQFRDLLLVSLVRIFEAKNEGLPCCTIDH